MATGTLGDVHFVNLSLNPLFSVQDTCPLLYQRTSSSETFSCRLAPPTPNGGVRRALGLSRYWLRIRPLGGELTCPVAQL